MKLFATLVLMTIYISAWTQDYKYDESTKSVIIQDVISSELSKEELHSRCQVFITSGYTHGTKMILVDNKESGLLTTEGGITHWGVPLYYTLKIDVKDQKIRYTVSSFFYEMTGNKTYFNTEKDLKANTKVLKKIGETLHSELTSALAVDDW